MVSKVFSEYCITVLSLVTNLNFSIEREGCIVVSWSSQADCAGAENITFKAHLQKTFSLGECRTLFSMKW